MWPEFLPSPKLASVATCIIGALMVYAYLQEKIMTKPYAYDGDTPIYFKNTLFLVLCNRILAVAFAIVALIVQGDMSQLKNQAPLYKYFLISFSNVLATSCQYEALKWVSLPTQTLFKCGKMVPVMIWSTIMFHSSNFFLGGDTESRQETNSNNAANDNNLEDEEVGKASAPAPEDSAPPPKQHKKKKYGPLDYLVACLVAIGCTIFLVSGKITSSRAKQSDSFKGILFMIGYLGFDGFTSTFQEKLFSGYVMTVFNQMLYVNMCSAVISFIFLITAGQLMESFTFAIKHPSLITDSVILSLSSVSGQVAITFTIKDFGALTYATIMTIRQFLSVLVSNIIFRHGMNALQWFGAILVFAALLGKSYLK